MRSEWCGLRTLLVLSYTKIFSIVSKGFDLLFYRLFFQKLLLPLILWDKNVLHLLKDVYIQFMMSVRVKKVYYSCVGVLGINPLVKDHWIYPSKSFYKKSHNTLWGTQYDALASTRIGHLLIDSTFHYMPYWVGWS